MICKNSPNRILYEVNIFISYDPMLILHNLWNCRTLRGKKPLTNYDTNRTRNSMWKKIEKLISLSESSNKSSVWY